MSSIIVMGPSFCEKTCISAAKTPVSTLKPRSLHRLTTFSYRGMAVYPAVYLDGGGLYACDYCSHGFSLLFSEFIRRSSLRR